MQSLLRACWWVAQSTICWRYASLSFRIHLCRESVSGSFVLVWRRLCCAHFHFQLQFQDIVHNKTERRLIWIHFLHSIVSLWFFPLSNISPPSVLFIVSFSSSNSISLSVSFTVTCHTTSTSAHPFLPVIAIASPTNELAGWLWSDARVIYFLRIIWMTGHFDNIMQSCSSTPDQNENVTAEMHVSGSAFMTAIGTMNDRSNLRIFPSICLCENQLIRQARQVWNPGRQTYGIPSLGEHHQKGQLRLPGTLKENLSHSMWHKRQVVQGRKEQDGRTARPWVPICPAHVLQVTPFSLCQQLWIQINLHLPFPWRFLLL